MNRDPHGAPPETDENIINSTSSACCLVIEHSHRFRPANKSRRVFSKRNDLRAPSLTAKGTSQDIFKTCLPFSFDTADCCSSKTRHLFLKKLPEVTILEKKNSGDKYFSQRRPKRRPMPDLYSV
ncbi:hypothetical protein V5799_011658 [Amblyomma americanum]|uniref:Uncharacterized protein n=1 Tax=Amblyomma americanum TaxID=6943 RepID=A0AAQ4EGM9_AMBAM